MRDFVARRASLAALAAIVVLGSSLLALTACNGKNADDWVVIHANRVASGTGGGPLDQCKISTGMEVASLPGCTFIEQGDKIGFANYYNDKDGGKSVIVKFNSPVFGVSDIKLQYQEQKVLEVTATPPSFFQITFELGGGHGGPVMLPKEPGGGS